VAKVKVEQLTQAEMIKLMIDWAYAHPHPDPIHGLETPEDRTLAELCESALDAIGRADLGGCVLCRS